MGTRPDNAEKTAERALRQRSGLAEMSKNREIPCIDIFLFPPTVRICHRTQSRMAWPWLSRSTPRSPSSPVSTPFHTFAVEPEMLTDTPEQYAKHMANRA